MAGLIWLAICIEAAAAMDVHAVCHAATVRVRAGNSMGSGTVFRETEQACYVLTNAHVVGQRLDARCSVEFWRTGYQSSPVPATVVAVAYAKQGNRDVAVLRVMRAALGGYDPPSIPIAPAEQRPDYRYLYSVGCAAGRWPTSFEGHGIELQQSPASVLKFVPQPAGGRSGSGIFDVSGSWPAIVGLLTWRSDGGDHSFDGRGEDGGHGMAQTHVEIHAALAGRPQTSRPLMKIDGQYVEPAAYVIRGVCDGQGCWRANADQLPTGAIILHQSKTGSMDLSERLEQTVQTEFQRRYRNTWRVLDPDIPTDHDTLADQQVRRLYERAKRDAGGHYPWLLVVSADRLTSRPMPTSTDELLALLQAGDEIPTSQEDQPAIPDTSADGDVVLLYSDPIAVGPRPSPAQVWDDSQCPGGQCPTPQGEQGGRLFPSLPDLRPDQPTPPLEPTPAEPPVEPANPWQQWLPWVIAGLLSASYFVQLVKVGSGAILRAIAQALQSVQPPAKSNETSEPKGPKW